MLSEKFGKLGDGDMALVETVGRFQSLQIGQTSFRSGGLGLGGRVSENTARSLEDGERRGGVTRIRDRGEGIVGAYRAFVSVRNVYGKGDLRL